MGSTEGAQDDTGGELPEGEATQRSVMVMTEHGEVERFAPAEPLPSQRTDRKSRKSKGTTAMGDDGLSEKSCGRRLGEGSIKDSIKNRALQRMKTGGVPTQLGELGEKSFRPKKACAGNDVGELSHRNLGEQSHRRTQKPQHHGDSDLSDFAEKIESSNVAAVLHFVIDPSNLWYCRWIALLCVLIFYTTSEVSFLIAFRQEFSIYFTLYPLAWTIDLLFVVNIFVQMRTGYFVMGKKVLDRPAIVRHYLRSFQGIAEMIACVPLDLLTPATGWEPLLRINKLLRLVSLPNYLQGLMNTSSSPRVIGILTVIRMALVWLVLTHTCACIRLLMAEDSGFGADEWSMEASLESAGKVTRYLTSLHWCMGLMTGMADGGLPITVGQFWFTVLMMTTGLFLFAFTVGVIGSLDEIRMKRATEMQTHVNAMQRFLTRYPEIPEDLIRSVTNFYSYNLRAESVGASATAAHLLDNLPLALRCEAVQCLTRDALSKVPLFSNAEEGFMIALTQEMTMTIACPGEELITFNTIGDAMFVVLRGQLDVIINQRVVNTLRPGSCFGEQSMLHKKPTVASVVAVSYCELYELHRHAFEELAPQFEKTFDGFKQAASLLAKQFKKGARGAKQKKVSEQIDERQSSSMKEGTGSFASRGRRRQSAFLGVVQTAVQMLADESDGHDEHSIQHLSVRELFALLKERLKKASWLILPWSKTRAVWGFFLLMALTYELLLLPVKIVFIGNNIMTVLVVLDALTDCVLFADVWLRFLLALLDDGQLVKDKKQLRARYRRTGFYPNLVGSVPLSPLLAAWPAVDARWLQLPRLIRMTRLLWWVRANRNDILILHQQPSNLEELLRLMRRDKFDLQFASSHLLPLLGLYVGLAHYTACAYFSVVLYELPPNAGDGRTMWKPDLPLDLPDYAFSEWLPTEELLRLGSIWR